MVKQTHQHQHQHQQILVRSQLASRFNSTEFSVLGILEWERISVFSESSALDAFAVVTRAQTMVALSFGGEPGGGYVSSEDEDFDTRTLNENLPPTLSPLLHSTAGQGSKVLEARSEALELHRPSVLSSHRRRTLVLDVSRACTRPLGLA